MLQTPPSISYKEEQEQERKRTELKKRMAEFLAKINRQLP